MAGINYSGQRPKTAKHLRGATKKKFKNDSEEARRNIGRRWLPG